MISLLEKDEKRSKERATIDEAIAIETMISEAHKTGETDVATNDLYTDLQNALTTIEAQLTKNNVKIKDLLKLDIKIKALQLKVNTTDSATMWSNARKYKIILQ